MESSLQGFCQEIFKADASIALGLKSSLQISLSVCMHDVLTHLSLCFLHFCSLISYRSSEHLFLIVSFYCSYMLDCCCCVINSVNLTITEIHGSPEQVAIAKSLINVAVELADGGGGMDR